MKIRLLVIIAALMISSCRNKAEEADAFGNFEATEVIISSETSGRILKFDAIKGMQLVKDEEITLIDTTIFHLQKAELDAGKKSVNTRLSSINAQNDILNQQIVNHRINLQRTDNMIKSDAATRKQYDDLAGQVAVLQKQILANNTQKASIAAEISVLEAKKSLLNEQINRCSVRSPLFGTLIEKYSEAGEVITPGRPLAKVADLSNMNLRVYVSGAQLGSIKTSQECTVRIDAGEKGYATFPGTITYIAGKAEFTPKIIQTKEERVTLVYAVIINVANDGALKSGMPGEALFNQ